MEVFDGLRDGTANHRSQFYQDITIPFYGYNRPGAKISQGIRDNWRRQGMMGESRLSTTASRRSLKPSFTTISKVSTCRFW